MVGKEHNNVMKDIRRIIEQLGEVKSYQSYFIESTYTNTQNKTLPNFLLTKKGCELFSTRMTGEKGTQFAVAYIERFNEMENHIKQTEIDLANLSPELQMFNGLFQALAKQELQHKQLEAKVDAMQEMVAVNIRNDWRKQTHHLSNAIAGQLGSNKFGLAKNMIFAEVEARAGVDLKTRLSNMKKRMREAGATALAVDKTTRVDVIAADKKLIEIYIAVIKEMAIKYGVYQQQLENNSGTAA